MNKISTFQLALQLDIGLFQIPYFLGALAPAPGSTDGILRPRCLEKCPP
ncbi:hypothetical protein J2797_006377 [Paraburkholderia terricola]|nr:hypothetical protein [Paraburkholderia terricola]MDR6496450.1 hypothetical protein [Paraburkholderia terricola]